MEQQNSARLNEEYQRLCAHSVEEVGLVAVPAPPPLAAAAAAAAVVMISGA